MIDVITDSDQITVSQPTDFKGTVGIGNEYHVDARIINDIPMGSNKNPCLLYTSPSPRDRS